MQLSINHSYFQKQYQSTQRYGYEHSIKLCKDAGFDFIDFGLGGKTLDRNIILRDNPLKEAEAMRELCEKLGVSVNQTHARYDYKNLTPEEFERQLKQTVEVSKILGADCVVVHADTYYDTEFRFDFDTVLNTIYETYAPIVERAKKVGIKIAMETLFEDRAPQGKRARFTSYVDELDAIVSKFNDEAVGICWDFGHARVSHGPNQFEEMKKVGGKIISTHVHDNYQKKDLHLMPFLGETNWELGMKTLKEIGYNGHLTFEAVYGCMPDCLVMDYLKLWHKVGRYLADLFEKS